MKKIISGLIAVIIIFLSACGVRDTTTAAAIVKGLTDAEIGLPAGKIYSTAADEMDEEYISDSLLSTLFGSASMPTVSSDWRECAMFLPLSNHPCEFIVIHCASGDAAEDTASLLSLRLISIKKAKGGEGANDLLDSSCVTVYKNYACLIISSDPIAAEKLIRSMIT